MATPPVNPFPALPGFTKEGIDGASRGWQINVAAGLTLALAIVVVILRMVTKISIVGSTNFEDYLAVAALVFAISRTAMDILLVQHYQLGYHIWDTLIPNFNTIYIYGKATSLLYLAGIACIKCSVLLLYMRLFGISRPFRWACRVIMIICIGYSITLGLAIIFQCRPISAGWNFFKPGHCVSLVKITIVNGGLNIFTDFAVVALPIPMIWKLQLRTTKFLALLAVFSSGLFVVAVSIVREVYIVRSPDSYDATWTEAQREMWLCIEMNVGVLVGCLPSLSPLSKGLPGMEYIKRQYHSMVSLLQPSTSRSDSRKTENVSGNDDYVELVESGKVKTKESKENLEV